MKVEALQSQLWETEQFLDFKIQKSGEATKILLVLWDGLRTDPTAWKEPRIKALCKNAESGLVELYKGEPREIVDLALEKENTVAVRKASLNFMAIYGFHATAEDKARFVPALKKVIGDQSADEMIRKQALNALAGLKQ